MNDTQDNPYAFPIATIDNYTQFGMTLRDYFAAKVLQSLATFNENMIMVRVEDAGCIADLAQDAYRMADAMLKARQA